MFLMLLYHVVTFKVTAVTEILYDLYKTNFTTSREEKS